MASSSAGIHLDIYAGLLVELYPDLENPGGPIRLSRQPTHTAVRVQVADDGMSATNEKASIYGHYTGAGIELCVA